MQPNVVREWVRIVRDLATIGLACFILVHEAIASRQPNWELIAAGLGLLGVPPVLRADELIRKANDNGVDSEPSNEKQKQDASDLHSQAEGGS